MWPISWSKSKKECIWPFNLSVRREAADLLRANGYKIQHEKKMWRVAADPAHFVPRAN
jgi:hypothetical protein